MNLVKPPSTAPWFKTLISGQPHQRIQNYNLEPYLDRWYIIPRNRKINVYLHHFLHSDDDRAIHDHPWWFISIILKGSYTEQIEDEDGDEAYISRHSIFNRLGGGVAFRPALHRHRVILDNSTPGSPILKDKPCWTLIITGPNSRTWGFWCSTNQKKTDRFIPWNEFGPGGCGEDV